MAEKNPKTGKPWTEAQDRTWDRKRGIKENSPRDMVIDKRRGLPADTGKGGGDRRRVGKGQGMPPPAMGAGAMPPITPPAGAAPPPAASPLPMPPGVRPPRPRRKPVPRPGAPGAGPTAGPPMPGPIVPGVGGGRGKGHSVKGGQRDPKGNNRPGVNTAGKQIGGGKRK